MMSVLIIVIATKLSESKIFPISCVMPLTVFAISHRPVITGTLIYERDTVPKARVNEITRDIANTFPGMRRVLVWVRRLMQFFSCLLNVLWVNRAACFVVCCDLVKRFEVNFCFFST